MAKITRVTQKIFGTAGNVGTGGFGAAAGGNVATELATSSSLSTLMNTTEWVDGWDAATLGSSKFPAVEDMNAMEYVNTTQLAYLFQQGIPEYDAGTTYYQFSICLNSGTYDIYGSNTNGNIGNALTDPTNWTKLGSLIAATPNLFTGGTSTGSANAQVVTPLSPATGFSLSNNGQTVIFTAGFTNTASATANLGGTGATIIKKDTGSGLAALSGGEIVLGDSIALTVNTAGACLVLEAGIPTSLFLQAQNNLSDLTNTATARTNLGLGTSATQNTSGYGVASSGGNLAIGLTDLTNSLGSDVAMSIANTWYDGPSVAQGVTGTFLVMATITYSSGSQPDQYQLRLTDGTTVFGATPVINSVTTSNPFSLSTSGIITNPVGNIKAQGLNTLNGNASMVHNASGQGKDCTINVVRIA